MNESAPADQKQDPAGVAKAALDGIADGATEIIVDDLSKWARQNLAAAK
ncbi:MAG TPA: hypothetical protein VGM75_12915 [Pseudonocardiaceae bacterium]